MKISYAITVCNERQEIKTLLNHLFKYIQPQDEIVVLYDEKNGDPEVWKYLNLVAVTDDNLLKGFEIHSSEFHGHFANWKNYLNSFCTGDYIFNIDADEIPSTLLIENIHDILELNPDIDVINVNRVNIAEGITEEHLRKWGWNINELGYINWPDRQKRIYRNIDEIVWAGKVHETLTGYKKISDLPDDFRLALEHIKTIKRQEKQNAYYDTL
jgi:hypothetical protein